MQRVQQLCFVIFVFIGTASAQDMMDHSHMPIAVPEHAEKISLSLHISPDAMSGYNLTLLTDNYLLTPPPSGLSMMQMMSAEISNDGRVQGHGHLYVNGEKVQRLYGNYVHLPANLFKQGPNSISVTLNNHGHMYWTQGGKKVVATLFINNNAEPLVKHRFASFPVDAKQSATTLAVKTRE